MAMNPNPEDHGLKLIREMVGGNWRHTWRAECECCGAVMQKAHASNAPGQAVVNSFKKSGWAVGKRVLCKEHAHRRKESANVVPMKKDQAAVRQPTTKEVLTVGAIIAQRFQVEPGRYEKGWSDARVADEAKCPIAIVERIREEGFGQIKVDPEVEALKDDLETLEGMVADMRKRLAAIERRQAA